MPRRKKQVAYATRRVKDHWLAVGLQPLSPNRFAKVVAKILDGSFALVAPSRADRPFDPH